MFNTPYTLSETIGAGDVPKIPCEPTELFYNPFQKFFFYFNGLTEIIMIDQGHTSQTGDACTLKSTPTATTFKKVILPGGVSYVGTPTYYSGKTYFVADYGGQS